MLHGGQDAAENWGGAYHVGYEFRDDGACSHLANEEASISLFGGAFLTVETFELISESDKCCDKVIQFDR